MRSSLLRPFSGSAGPTGDIVGITPEDVGWSFVGLQVLELRPGVRRTVHTRGSEVFVLPLSGGLRVDVVGPDGAQGRFELQGRASVFTRVTDFLYVGRDSSIDLDIAHGGVVALPSARCTRRLPARYCPADDVPVEVRGAGPATRQVTNFGVPGAWDHADKLICCELLTPPGNWSSYPPHKHDVTAPCPVVNEELYYYRVAGRDQVTPARQGFGTHRTYTGPEHVAAGLRRLDESMEVRDHDVVLVPHGYHGPCMAAPGYPLYYLNVLAGPADERSLAFCDDPDHAWLRERWAEETPDPRCPVTSPVERPHDAAAAPDPRRFP